MKNLLHEGFPFVRTIVDNFQAPGLEGPHLCLVYEPMRELLWIFQQRWENSKLPVTLVKVYLGILLLRFDYLHSECSIIRTSGFKAILDVSRGPNWAYSIRDVKLDNILLGF